MLARNPKVDDKLLAPILTRRIEGHAFQYRNRMKATNWFSNLDAILSEPLQVFADLLEDRVRNLNVGSQIGHFGSQFGYFDPQLFMRFRSRCWSSLGHRSARVP